MGIAPAAWMTLATPLMLAWWLDARPQRTWVNDAVALALIVLPVGLVLEQPDAVVALLMVSSAAWVLWLMRARRVLWLLLLAVVIGTTAVTLTSFQKPYPTQLVYSNGAAYDSHSPGYQQRLSQLIIGGGLAAAADDGQRLGDSGLIHRASGGEPPLLKDGTDRFVFAVISHDFGAAAAGIVALLLLTLTLRGLVLAAGAVNAFGRSAAAAIVWTFFGAVALNLAAGMNVFPLSPPSLPLMGSGGNALLVTLAGFGLVLALTNKGLGAPATATDHQVGGRQARQMRVVAGVVLLVSVLLAVRYVDLQRTDWGAARAAVLEMTSRR